MTRLGKSVRLRGIAAGVSLALLGTVGVVSAQPPLTPATFVPLWLPQAQFAGYYVAYERGMYRQHGIDLTILTGGPDCPASQLLEHGQADFATLWLSTAIRLRARGVAIVNAAQVVQRSSLVLVAKKARGIHVPSDLNGKKVSVWEGDFLLQPLAFFKKYHLDVHIVPQGSSINLFLRDGVDAAVAMWYNEYHTILNAGVDADELTTFFFHDPDLDFPEDGVYCRAALAAGALCNAFAAASLAGWRYAFAHPDEALDVVMRYMDAAHLSASRVHQRWMLARMQDVILPTGDTGPHDAHRLGVLRESDYDRVARALLADGSIGAVPDFASFYRGVH